jgi:hypothetical protein
MLAESVKAARTTQPSRTIRLLPAFDPYVIAASPHCEFMFNGDHKARIYRPQGWVTPVILVDGRMAGVWEWERKGKRIVVDLEPFGRAPKWLVKGAEREAARLAEWLGGALESRERKGVEPKTPTENRAGV